MSYTLDAETFISEVKKHPDIWHPHSEGNRYQRRGRDVWEGVARVFIPDLDTMSEADRFEVYRKLYSKWRNLRDAYVRNLKRKDGKRDYMYAKALSFLKVVYEHKADGSDSSEEDTKRPSRVRQIQFKTSADNTYSEEEGSSTIDNLKRRRLNNAENIEFVSTVPGQDMSYVGDDADRSFFDSVLPAVREFDMDQKLEFRSEVLKLIKKIRSVPLIHNIKLDQISNYSE